MRSANNVGPHVRQTFLNDVFTFLTEVGNAGGVVNTGTSSINSEFVTTLIYMIFYLFLVNIIGNCHENKFILQSVHLLYKYAIRINFCFIRTRRINFSAYE